MFHNIRQDRDIIRSLRVKFVQQTRVNIKPDTPRNGGGSCVELKAFHLKSVAGVDPKAPPFITPNIDEPPGTASRVK